MYRSETRGVVIKVEPDYLDDESEPGESRFVWSYTVEIENTRAQPIQLMSREWRITDAMNRTEIVRGDGVVGEQPVIKPGGRYRYTSGAPLPTPSGFMSGAYVMRSKDGEEFCADIPAFSLDTPHDRFTLH
ncbi:Co2+/Mg2+ efflux protein ApaG [Marinicauda salina]|jgi:ApaG protein|uniref:Protein ApaG n=1 Tax=Marinicauda salina TaxID=2135793 RepID=A0A2U2BXY0_9PROT|nr:Co2+/Mg2+ efflux protein ApaG [Marinicauda salina]PWE18839.1 Co2+/Mg2+ efflux protein ApaG [Marinicauda salina]